MKNGNSLNIKDKIYLNPDLPSKYFYLLRKLL